jgi:hypothetical protein
MWRYQGAAALFWSVAMIGGAAAPASAQFYLQPHDFSGKPVKGDEPGMVVPLPGATADEYKAALAWTMRSALNVAALQCQFEPMLNSVQSYNAILRDHDAEFDKDQATLQKYYARMPGAGAAKAGKGSKAGQAGFDRFGTQTYSAFSTTAAQFGFCQTAASIAREAVFTPRGQFGDLAERRMRELRNSLVPFGEEQYPYYYARSAPAPVVPRLDAQCWNKKGEWQAKKCGAQNWPAIGTGVATR